MNSRQIPDELKPVVAAPRRQMKAPAAPRKKSRRVPGSGKKSGGRRTGFLWSALRVVLWIFTIIASAGMVAASYGGNIAPDAIKGISLMILTFPVWLTAIIAATVLDALWCRKALIVCVAVLICCATAIWDFCPLNVFNPSAKKYADKPHFTIMTYNVLSLMDNTGTYPGDVNPTIAYILHSNADIVNIQECYPITVSTNHHVTQEQIDSLHRVYPYIFTSGQDMTLLSKYPVEPLHIPADPSDSSGGINYSNAIAAFRINIAGTAVTLFNVHLESYGLSRDDKDLYQKVTELDESDIHLRSTLREVRTELIDKIQKAAVKRAAHTERLLKLIDHFGGPNVIVAGDFNDVPGCYALRRLGDCGLKQVYPELAFGPAVSYNTDRFYFRIDHILWRGAMKPLRLWRGNVRYSDHYPFTALFTLTD